MIKNPSLTPSGVKVYHTASSSVAPLHSTLAKSKAGSSLAPRAQQVVPSCPAPSERSIGGLTSVGQGLSFSGGESILILNVALPSSPARSLPTTIK